MTVIEFFFGNQHWHAVFGWHVALLIVFGIGWWASHHTRKPRRHIPSPKRGHR